MTSNDSPMYRVRWEIDLDATDLDDAAARALAIHRDPESIATYFEVTEHGSDGPTAIVDFHPEAA